MKKTNLKRYTKTLRNLKKLTYCVPNKRKPHHCVKFSTFRKREGKDVCEEREKEWLSAQNNYQRSKKKVEKT